VSPVRYELGFCIPGKDILHSHRRENLKSYIVLDVCVLCPCTIHFLELIFLDFGIFSSPTSYGIFGL
jgi:hypothetical protein